MGPRVPFSTSAVVGGARGSSGFIPDFGCRWRGPRVSFPTSAVVGGARGSSGFIPDFGRRWWGPRVFSHFPFFLLAILYLFLSFSLFFFFLLFLTWSSFLLTLSFSLFLLCLLFSLQTQPPPSLKKLVTAKPEDVSLVYSFSG